MDVVKNELESWSSNAILIFWHGNNERTNIVAGFFVEGSVSTVAQGELVGLPATAVGGPFTRQNLACVHRIPHNLFVHAHLDVVEDHDCKPSLS